MIDQLESSGSIKEKYEQLVAEKRAKEALYRQYIDDPEQQGAFTHSRRPQHIIPFDSGVNFHSSKVPKGLDAPSPRMLLEKMQKRQYFEELKAQAEADRQRRQRELEELKRPVSELPPWLQGNPQPVNGFRIFNDSLSSLSRKSFSKSFPDQLDNVTVFPEKSASAPKPQSISIDLERDTRQVPQLSPQKSMSATPINLNKGFSVSDFVRFHEDIKQTLRQKRQAAFRQQFENFMMTEKDKANNKEAAKERLVQRLSSFEPEFYANSTDKFTNIPSAANFMENSQPMVSSTELQGDEKTKKIAQRLPELPAVKNNGFFDLGNEGLARKRAELEYRQQLARQIEEDRQRKEAEKMNEIKADLMEEERLKYYQKRLQEEDQNERQKQQAFMGAAERRQKVLEKYYEKHGFQGHHQSRPESREWWEKRQEPIPEKRAESVPIHFQQEKSETYPITLRPILPPEDVEDESAPPRPSTEEAFDGTFTKRQMSALRERIRRRESSKSLMSMPNDGIMRNESAERAHINQERRSSMRSAKSITKEKFFHRDTPPDQRAQHNPTDDVIETDSLLEAHAAKILEMRAKANQNYRKLPATASLSDAYI